MALDNIRFADQFSGSDIGAQINAAYASLPSTGGIVVVAKGGSFSTPIVFNTVGKTVLLIGSPGNSVVLTYTPTTGIAITFNFGTGHEMGAGLRDLTLTGPGNTTSTTGVIVGGTNGAEGVRFSNFKIQSFGTNLTFGSNTWIVEFDHGMIRDGGTNVNAPGGLTAEGENMLFHHITFADAPTPFTNSVWIRSGEVRFESCSFDQAQLRIGDSVGGYAAQVSAHHCHFENPNLGATYDFIVQDNRAGCVLFLTDSELAQDLTSGTYPEFMTVNGGEAYVRGFQMFSATGSTFTHFAVVNNSAIFTIYDFTDLSGSITSSLLAGNTGGWIIQRPGANPGAAARNEVVGAGALDSGGAQLDFRGSVRAGPFVQAMLTTDAYPSADLDANLKRLALGAGTSPEDVFLTRSGAGDVTLSAGGANQSVILQPSGTGNVKLAGPVVETGQQQGLGNAASANLTAPGKGTGTGPASLAAVSWVRITINGTVYWIPLFQ